MQWWQKNIKWYRSHVDPFPNNTQNALCSKLSAQVENKVKPYPFQTRQPKSFSYSITTDKPQREYAKVSSREKKESCSLSHYYQEGVFLVFINTTF